MQSADKNILHNNKEREEKCRQGELWQRWAEWGGVIYMATKRYNNEGSSKTEIVGQEMRNAWVRLLLGQLLAQVSVLHTHTHIEGTLPHTVREREGKRGANALGQGVSAPRRLKQMMQIRFRCPSAKQGRERKAKRKISKNFSWHTGNFYLPAATFATPTGRSRRRLLPLEVKYT